jgi:hypothetical protein
MGCNSAAKVVAADQYKIRRGLMRSLFMGIFAMAVEALCALKVMTLTSTKTQGEKDNRNSGKKREMFHRAPLRDFS